MHSEPVNPRIAVICKRACEFKINVQL